MYVFSHINGIINLFSYNHFLSFPIFHEYAFEFSYHPCFFALNMLVISYLVLHLFKIYDCINRISP